MCFTPQLQQTDDATEFRDLVNAHYDLISDSGYHKPIATSTLDNKEEIVMTIFLHQTVYSCLAELDQLKRGLNVLGVIDELSESPDILLDFFTAINRVRLTAGWFFSYTDNQPFMFIYLCIERVQDLFEPVEFSRERGNIEGATYMQFTRLLNEAEGIEGM